MIVQVGISCKWINDSQSFLLEHLDTINGSPSHIYHSALPSSSHLTWLHEYYGLELLQEVKVVKGLSAGWGTCSRTVSFGTRVFGSSYWNNIVAVASGLKDIIILDTVTGSQEAILSGHADEVNSVSFSSDGRLLVSGSDDKTVKLWDVQTGGTIQTFSGHTELVCTVSISVDSATIASGSEDCTIRVWSVQTGECCSIIKDQGTVGLIKFSPTNPHHFLSMGVSEGSQWNISGYQIGHKLDLGYFNFSPDGTQLVFHHQGFVTVQNSSSGEVVVKFQTVRVELMCCCFSPDARMVAVSTGSTASVWNIASTEPYLIETFIGHTDVITCFAFSSSSSLISGSWDGSVKFWKIGAQSTGPTGTHPKSISLTQVSVMSITLPVGDDIFITSGSDGIVKTWEIFTGIHKASYQTPAKGTNKRDVQMINGRLVLVWDKIVEIMIWDIERKELLLTADRPSSLEDIKISEDGSRVFIVGEEVIQAQSMQTGEIMAKAGINFIKHVGASLTVYGSRVWVWYSNGESLVWDFGIPDSPPIQLPDISLHIFNPNGTMLWDTGLLCVKGAATGKVVFWLPKRFGRPANVKWSDQYLLVAFISGEVLALDFSYVIPP